MADKEMFQIYRTEDSDKKAIQKARESAEKARKVLQSHAAPDTFIGRKTQEPFPLPDQQE